jgi:hypothetical protein
LLRAAVAHRVFSGASDGVLQLLEFTDNRSETPAYYRIAANGCAGCQKAAKREDRQNKYLNSRSGLISCVHHSAGIYYVHGEAFPIQIVLTDSLNKADNLWLKALRHDIEADTINMVFEGYKPNVNFVCFLRPMSKR